jgi:hypothetical protein
MALPLLELGREMTPARAAVGDELRRLVVVQFPNGCYLPDWTPPALGADWSPSPILEPLAAHRDDITVISGLSNQAAVSSGHDAVSNPHARRFPALLTGTGVQPDGAGGVSVDQLVAQALEGVTVRPSLVAALTARNDLHEGRFSFAAPDTPVAPVLDPQSLFDQLFADGLLDPAEQERLVAERRSVLDHVAEDLVSLHGELGVSDRVRLEEHLDAVRDLESSIQVLGCEPPASPASTDPQEPEQREQRCRILIDLLVMALRCDLTRVVTLSLGATAGEPTYPFLGVPEGDHTVSHLPTQDPVARDKYLTITRWKMAQVAHLLDRLVEPELDGRMLDRCALICTSELSHGGSHDAAALPVWIAGGLGGHVGGQHVAVECDPMTLMYPPADKLWCTGSAHTPLSNLWLTAIRAMGIEAETFGDANSTLEGLWNAAT